MPRWPAPQTRLNLTTFEREQKCLRCPRWAPPASFRGRRTCADCKSDDNARHTRAWRARRGLKGYAGRARDAAGRFVAALLLLTACSFKTDAIDGAMGTSCSHYELDAITVETSADCWRDRDQGGDCFFSETGACREPTQRFRAGQRLTLWCELSSPGEAHTLEPADCGLMW